MSAFIESRITLVLAAAMLLACAWGGTRVMAEEGVRSERVSFRDLKVETPEGVRALYGRIHAAATRVRPQYDPVYREAGAFCIGKAESQAVQKLNLQQLTAYYQMKTKPSGDRQPLVAAR
jgi:UrcA family protein